MLRGRRVLVGVGGGIAAYKIAEVVSRLFQGGAEIRVIFTATATKFITPLTLSTLSRHRAYTDEDFWAFTHQRPLHIELGEWAEIFLIAPLTANTLGKLNYGLADNLLTNTVLASPCPILLAPAMNTQMWEQLTVQRNWQQIKQNPRYHTIEPGSGLLACDRVGKGRMAEPEEILIALQSLLHTNAQKDLQGKKILISAGGTREYLDPVRFLGNPATGKMGVALAQAAHYRGAEVTFVHAPMTGELLALLPQIHRLAVVSAAEMHQEILNVFPEADWLFMVAAVADVKPVKYTAQKLPKHSLPESLPLEPVPDILKELAQQKQPQQRVIGFAAQTGDIITPALGKLKGKKLDAIAANPIDKPNAGFASDTNQAILLDSQGRKQEVASCTKLELAHHLLDFVLQLQNTTI